MSSGISPPPEYTLFVAPSSDVYEVAGLTPGSENGWSLVADTKIATKIITVSKRKAKLNVTTQNVTFDGEKHEVAEFIKQVDLVPEKAVGETEAPKTVE